MRVIPVFLAALGLAPASALRAATLTVTNANDSGPGSLRQAIAESPAGDTILFDPAVFDGEPADVITLVSYLSLRRSVIIDASDLPAGVTISGGGVTQIFRVSGSPTYSFALHGLTLTGGWDSFKGGAIFHISSSLALTRCTLSGNSAGDSGGAIFGFGASVLTLTNCTLSGNSAGTRGGAIDADFSLALRHCTLSGNTAGTVGGGIAFGNSGTFTLEGSIVAGNTSGYGSGQDISTGATIVCAGGIIVQSRSGSFAGTGPFLTVPPRLAPLGDYGGPTHTMALPLDSPARNRGTVSDVATDQRGFPRVGLPDLGAYEAGNALLGNRAAYLRDIFFASTTEAERDPDFDYDGDGASNGDEWLALTHPRWPASVLRAAVTREGADLVVSFPSVAGRRYTLWQSETLPAGSFTDTGLPALTGDGGVLGFTFPDPSPDVPRSFYAVQVGP